MAATVTHLPVTQPQPAPFPVMTPAELAEFWAAVQMLRAERARHEPAAAGSAAILAAVPS
jgi:hypothetical protein